MDSQSIRGALCTNGLKECFYCKSKSIDDNLYHKYCSRICFIDYEKKECEFLKNLNDSNIKIRLSDLENLDLKGLEIYMNSG